MVPEPEVEEDSDAVGDLVRVALAVRDSDIEAVVLVVRVGDEVAVDVGELVVVVVTVIEALAVCDSDIEVVSLALGLADSDGVDDAN